MPAVPPCLTFAPAKTGTSCSLCRVPTHSSPVTPASRLSYSAMNHPSPFASPSEAHYTETASARIPPSRVLCKTVPQFYFLFNGLLYSINVIILPAFSNVNTVFLILLLLRHFSVSLDFARGGFYHLLIRGNHTKHLLIHRKRIVNGFNISLDYLINSVL